MTKNCNHFAEALATRLVNKPFPGYVNRMANLGGMVSCLIPPGMLGDAPVGGQQQSGAGETSMGGYQVIVPRNRQTNSTPSTASITAQTPQVTGGGGFIGKGMKLGIVYFVCAMCMYVFFGPVRGAEMVMYRGHNIYSPGHNATVKASMSDRYCP